MMYKATTPSNEQTKQKLLTGEGPVEREKAATAISVNL